MGVTVMDAEQFVASELVPTVRNRFAAYRFAERHPRCVFRDGRRVLFIRERIEELVLGGSARPAEHATREASA